MIEAQSRVDDHVALPADALDYTGVAIRIHARLAGAFVVRVKVDDRSPLASARDPISDQLRHSHGNAWLTLPSPVAVQGNLQRYGLRHCRFITDRPRILRLLGVAATAGKLPLQHLVLLGQRVVTALRAHETTGKLLWASGCRQPCPGS